MSAERASRDRQRGAALIVAVFLLVVLGALGAFAVRLTLMQQQTVNSELLAAQAFQAARSGVAWAAHRAVNDGWCASATLALTEGGAAGFSVDVSCTQTVHVEGGATIGVYVIDALAEYGSYGKPDYVSRRVEAKVTDES